MSHHLKAASEASPLILASIGTVLIDIFEPTSPTASLWGRSAASSRGTSASQGALSRPSPGASTRPSTPSVPAVTPPLVSLPLPTRQSAATSPGSASASPSSRGAQTPQIEAFGEISRDSKIVIGGGAMYALIGARVWLAPQSLRTVIDRSPGTTRRDPEDGRGTSGKFLEREMKRQGQVTKEVEAVESLIDDPLHPPPVADTEFPGDDEFDDLPLKLEKQLHSYGPEMWVFNRVPGARVPTARIRYDDAVRSYAHIVKPAVRSGRELASGPLAGAEWLHVPPPYSSTALLGLISELSLTSWHPRIVFEPAPTSCHPGELTAFEKAAALVDVLSPNHEELLSLYARPIPDDRQEIIEAVEKVMRHLLALGVGSRGKGILAIRCSSLGACIGTAEGGICWIPSFFQGEQHRVQDVTGAGNAFIGGYIAGLYLTGDPYEAALHGTVSASFVIEQLGPPILHFTPEGERWNGDSAESRLATLSGQAKQAVIASPKNASLLY